MSELHLPGTCRVSLAMYNTPAEVDFLVAVLQKLVADRVHKAEQKLDSKQAAPLAENVGHALCFAEASAESPATAAEELIEEFLLFDDRESKTELLMELGQSLPDYFDALKAISQPVPGCMSEVYLIGRPIPDQPDKFEFMADSNAEIVRGLIALLEALFSGQPAAEILSFNIEDVFRKLGLEQFISTQRRSGLDGMIRRIRTLAQTIVDRDQAPASPAQGN